MRHANPAARDALAGGQAIRLVDERLRCSNRSDDKALAEALAAMAIAAPTSRAKERRFIRLRGTDALQRFGLSLSALRPAETLGAFGSLPLAMLVLHDGNQPAQCDPFVIQELFDLTPAEADVGALLSLGHKLEEIARLRHVALSTVRSQLRTLLAKTGTERQSDLVRRLLTLPHGLGG
jgi:DNA-binding CsgD family transcriptional regulator